MNDGPKVALVVVGAVLLAGLAWVSMRPADTNPGVATPDPLATSGKSAAKSGEHEGDRQNADPEVGAEGQGDTDAGDAIGNGVVGDGAVPGGRRADRVEGAVHLVLGTVAPELHLEEVERSCTADGRRCTFEGEWPGDDFLKRWVQATSNGEISSEQLRGVVFERFEPVEYPDGRHFEIEAVLKPPHQRNP